MPSRSRALGTILLIATDVVALGASFLIAFYLRFDSGLESLSGISNPDLSGYFNLGVVITVSAPFLFAASGMYKPTNLHFGLTEYVLALRSTALLVLVLIFVSFIVGAEPIVSRTWIAIWVVVCVLLVMLTRFLARRFTTLLRKRGIIQESVLIVGADAQGVAIAQQLVTVPGVNVMGFIDEFLPVGTRIRNQFTILGSTKQIDTVAKDTEADTVLMIPAAISWESRQFLMLSTLRPKGTRKWELHIAPGVYEMASLGAELGRVGNIPVLRLHGSSIVGLDAFMKRLIDIWISFGLLAIFGVPILMVATYTKLRGRRVLNRTVVTGLNGTAFQLLSLNIHGDTDGFPDGLERLPMLFHLLNGDMSVIGPRPRSITDASHGDHPELLAVRPGIVSVVPRSVVLGTGDEWTRIEAMYTRNYSIWSDITLLLRAFLMGLRYLSPLGKSPKRPAANQSNSSSDVGAES
jgi:lipopolysaccharide/colanic/teichoic acid biosynthesis glycosyltransferase